MGKRRKEERLVERKKEIANNLPPLGEVLRGTFIKVYLESIRPQCKCHKDKKYNTTVSCRLFQFQRQNRERAI